MQPVELARKLAKEMDDHRTISIHRVYVPNEYTVYLNPADREQFAAYETQMRNELAEYLVEHARREGYSPPTRPLVLLETERRPDGRHVRDRRVDAEATRGEDAPGEPSRDGRRPRGAAGRRRAADPAAPVLPPHRPPRPARARRWSTPPSPSPSPEPEPEPSRSRRASARCSIWDGGDVTLDQRVIVIGRSSDCDIVVDDPNVSRRHAEVRRIGDGYSLVDLGSTNGTEVNGQRIRETALMNGDVIAVGTTRITFERRLG